jgi:crossover junction endodeoxyribonuclease RuvC
VITKYDKIGVLTHRNIPMLRILGCDVGSKNFGLSVVEFNPNPTLLLEKTLLLKEPNIKDRLVTLKTTLAGLIEEFSIEKIVFEMPYIRGKNAAGLLYVCGVITLLAGEYSIPVIDYTATEVKKAVTNTGKAEKDLVESSVIKLLDSKDTISFSSDHSSDAAAIALTYYLKNIK